MRGRVIIIFQQLEVHLALFVICTKLELLQGFVTMDVCIIKLYGDHE